MRSFKQFLSERYVNLIGDAEKKEKYADEVWKVLQKSYAPIGGIKGSGFKNKQDMIDNIPFWKLAVKDGRVVAVVMYKDKNGRKSVAFGTDGSEAAGPVVQDILKNELQRSFGEKSKAMLGKMIKTVPWNVLKNFLMTPDQAQKILGKEVTPVSEVPFEDLPDDGKMTLKKTPELKKYAYIRDISGSPTFKVLLGTPNLKVR